MDMKISTLHVRYLIISYEKKKKKKKNCCKYEVIVCTPFKFSKRVGLARPQFLEGGCWERGVTFFRSVAVFYTKNEKMKNLDILLVY